MAQKTIRYETTHFIDRCSSAPLQTPSFVWTEELYDMILCRCKSYPGNCRHNLNPNSCFATPTPTPRGGGYRISSHDHKSHPSNWRPPFQPPSGHQRLPRSPPAQKYPVLRTIVPSATRRHVSVNLRALTPNWGEGHEGLQSFETRGEKPGDWLSLKAKWSKRNLKCEGMGWQTSRKSTKNTASIIHCLITWPCGPILVLHLMYTIVAV